MKALTPFKERIYSEHICWLGGWRSLSSQCIWALKEFKETLCFITSFVSSCSKLKGGPRPLSPGVGLASPSSISHRAAAPTQGTTWFSTVVHREKLALPGWELFETNLVAMSTSGREDSLSWAKDGFRWSALQRIVQSTFGQMRRRAFAALGQPLMQQKLFCCGSCWYLKPIWTA